MKTLFLFVALSFPSVVLAQFEYTIDTTAAANIVADLAVGDVTIDTTTAVLRYGGIPGGGFSGITITDPILYSSPNNLTILSQNAMNVQAHIQNSHPTSGDINLVSGWDGSTAFDAATFNAETLGTTSVFGGSSFVIGGSSAGAVAVGARSGSTRVYSGSFSFDSFSDFGSPVAYRHLGFRFENGLDLAGTNLGQDAMITGPVLLRVNSGTFIRGGSSANSYGQIGHVGLELIDSTVRNGIVDASITVESLFNMTVQPGSPSGTYAQIGHGGEGAETSVDGKISVLAGESLDLNSGGTGGGYTQIGHGGLDCDGPKGANTAGSSVSVESGRIDVRGGGSADAYSMIGHGGLRADSSITGDAATTANGTGFMLVIANSGSIAVQGGSGDRCFAAIGHGGAFTTGMQSSSLFVDALSVLNVMAGNGEDSYAQVGHGGRSATGPKGSSFDALNINCGDLSISGGSNSRGYAQVGNGGHGSTGDATGRIFVTTPVGGFSNKNVNLTTFGGLDAYVQIGHGGARSVGQFGAGSSGVETAINVQAIGNIALDSFASGGAGAYTQIGSGGLGSTASVGNISSTAVLGQGNITVNSSGGSMTLLGSFQGGALTSSPPYAQIGHGGADSFGIVDDQISVSANMQFDLTSGNVPGGYAQIGHGGNGHSGQRGDVNGVVGNSSINLVGSSIRIDATQASQGGYAQVGHGGSNHSLPAGVQFTGVGSVNLQSSTNIELNSSTNSGSPDGGYTQIGHGGTQSTTTGFMGEARGPISVTASERLTLRAGTAGTISGDSFCQIGHGGLNFRGNRNQNCGISITSPSLTMSGGRSAGSFAQIGHGGIGDLMDAGNIDGTIQVTSTDNGLFLNGGTASQCFALLGHGGYRIDGDIAGTTNVQVNTTFSGADLAMEAGTAEDCFTQVGHGGTLINGAINSPLHVSVSGACRISSGTGTSAYARIGMGGKCQQGVAVSTKGLTIPCDVNVTAQGFILNGPGITSGDRTTQIGNGGAESLGSCRGDVRVAATSSLQFVGRNTTTDYLHIGNGNAPGGTDTGLTMEGDCVVIGASLNTFNAYYGNLLDAGGTSRRGTTLIDVSGDIRFNDVGSQPPSVTVIMEIAGTTQAADALVTSNTSALYSLIEANDVDENPLLEVYFVNDFLDCPETLSFDLIETASATGLNDFVLSSTVTGLDSFFQITSNGLINDPNDTYRLQIANSAAATTYLTWAKFHGLTGANWGIGQSSTSNGRTNAEHFAFDTDPLTSNSDEGKMRVAIVEDSGQRYFTLTLPVYKTVTSFSGTRPLQGGTSLVTYRFFGDDNLIGNNTDVALVAPALASGLPPLNNFDGTAGAEYNYQTVRLNTPINNLFSRGFITPQITFTGLE